MVMARNQYKEQIKVYADFKQQFYSKQSISSNTVYRNIRPMGSYTYYNLTLPEY